jgi:hypothetical protein
MAQATTRRSFFSTWNCLGVKVKSDNNSNTRISYDMKKDRFLISLSRLLVTDTWEARTLPQS